MTEAARLATPDDIPRIAELARAAHAEMTVLRGGPLFLAREARSEPLQPALAVELADTERHAVFAGTLDDVILGYAAVRIEDLRTGDVLAIITDLYVEPEARAVGLGELLMGAALDWCKERHATAVDAYALPGDRNTKNFFEMSGFTARLLVMHHKL
jgi:GNAT superfamily N-acetyltransferase